MTVRVEVHPTAAAMGDRAADLIGAQLVAGTPRVLGVATGSSPSPACAALAARRLPGWAGVSDFALDEYVGLHAQDPRSHRAVIDREVRAPLGLEADRVHAPDGTASDLEAACREYERALREAGGSDLQLLGIGATGHIGLNEPGSPLTSTTRVVTLSERTRRDNARFFENPEDGPRCAVTQGVATTGSARHHLLLARGEQKAAAVVAALEGPVDQARPASALQTFDDVVVLLGQPAASLLREPPGLQGRAGGVPGGVIAAADPPPAPVRPGRQRQGRVPAAVSPLRQSRAAA